MWYAAVSGTSEPQAVNDRLPLQGLQLEAFATLPSPQTESGGGGRPLQDSYPALPLGLG